MAVGPPSQPEGVPDSVPDGCLGASLGVLWNQNGPPGSWMLWLLTECIIWSQRSPEPQSVSLIQPTAHFTRVLLL